MNMKDQIHGFKTGLAFLGGLWLTMADTNADHHQHTTITMVIPLHQVRPLHQQKVRLDRLNPRIPRSPSPILRAKAKHITDDTVTIIMVQAHEAVDAEAAVVMADHEDSAVAAADEEPTVARSVPLVQ